MVPSRVVPRSRDKRNPGSESSAESQKQRGYNKNPDLGPESSLPKFLNGVLRENKSKKNEGNREKCRNSEVGGAKELDIAVDSTNVMGEGIKALNCSCDECHKHEDNGSIINLKSE